MGYKLRTAWFRVLVTRILGDGGEEGNWAEKGAFLYHRQRGIRFIVVAQDGGSVANFILFPLATTGIPFEKI